MTETNLIDCEVQHAERENFKSEEMTDADVIAIMQAIEEKVANNGLVADKVKIFWNELECPNNYNFDPTSDIDRQRIVDMFTFVGKYNVCVEEDYIELTKCEPKVEIYIEEQKKLESKEMSAADVISIMEAIENKIIENEFVDGRVKIFWNELELPYDCKFDLTNATYKVQIAEMYALISEYNVCLEEDYIELVKCVPDVEFEEQKYTRIARMKETAKKIKDTVSRRCKKILHIAGIVVKFLVVPILLGIAVLLMSMTCCSNDPLHSILMLVVSLFFTALAAKVFVDLIDEVQEATIEVVKIVACCLCVMAMIGITAMMLILNVDVYGIMLMLVINVILAFIAIGIANTVKI